MSETERDAARQHTEPTENGAATAVPEKSRVQVIQASLTITALLLSLVVGMAVEGATLWGLLPIAVYAVLILAGIEILLSSAAALLSGLLLMQADPLAASTLLGEAMGSEIVLIGLIIMLGAGLGEVLTRTRGASYLVQVIVDRLGVHTQVRAQLSIMLASAVLVIALGTLIGAFAVAAPIVLPIAARLRFAKSATALMMFIGGSCGMFVAPFVGSMVAIREYSGVSYPDYVLTAGGPLAIVCFAVGYFIVRYCQRRPLEDDFYDPDEFEAPDETLPRSARTSTIAFLIAFAVLVTYGVATKAGTGFAIIALIVMAFAAGSAARLPLTEILKTLYRGCGRVVDMFLLFWVLAALLAIVEELRPYDVLLTRYGDDLEQMGVLTFLVLISLIGWLGISGASAAQVIVIDQVFGSTASALGVPVSAWAVVLLCSCQADTFGPFPGPNMVSPMAFARSTALKRMIYCGWILLTASLIVYVTELAILT